MGGRRKGLERAGLAGAGILLSAMQLQAGEVIDADAAVEGEGETLDAETPLLRRTIVLSRLETWGRFRDLWAGITRFEADTTGAWGDQEARDSLTTELYRLQPELVEEAAGAGIDTSAVSLLVQLTFDRIDAVTAAGDLLMTRMMPPPVWGQLESLAEDVEARLDSLARLRASGSVPVESLRTTVRSLVETVDVYCVLAGVAGESGYRFITWPLDVDSVGLLIDSLASESAALRESHPQRGEGYPPPDEDVYGRMREAYDEAVAGLPELNALLLDLLAARE